mmetsp:Transcript_74162/g.239958  ORF Transcript_74162/g.239958 Transcript_74162/m.239958 type:complete len:102 (+) Transcript_74162:65-370(+)
MEPQDAGTVVESEAVDQVMPADPALEELLESQAKAWCTPKAEGADSWQEFIRMIDRPVVELSAGLATQKFEYSECDTVLKSVDRATVIYDIKSGKATFCMR